MEKIRKNRRAKKMRLRKARKIASKNKNIITVLTAKEYEDLRRKEIENKTDQELVEMSMEDGESYGHLIARYDQKLRRYVVKLCGGRTDYADDVLQSVFIKIYKNLNYFNPELKFFSWIYRVAHNETIDFLRKVNRRPVTYNFDIEAVAPKSSKEETGIEKEIDRKMLAKDIAEVISGLEEKYRRVLLLRYMEDKDYQEISRDLGKPPGTVATLLRQAKEKFKKEILKRRGYWSDNFRNK